MSSQSLPQQPLKWTSESEEETTTIPDQIDLTTAQGQALFKRLQQSGLIRLPDIDDLVDEGEV